MNPGKKHRARRPSPNPSELSELGRINEQLARLQTPVDPDVLARIDNRLGRIETSLDRIHADASRRGALAGGMAGSITSLIIWVAIELTKARLGT